MTNTTTNRVCGVLLFLAGIPFTIWLVWLVREAAFDYHIVMAGPMVTVFGAALAILGRTDLRNSDGTPSRVRMMLVTLPCALTGMLALHATQEHDFPPLEKLLDSYKQKAAPPEHVVTREEVDAAIKEVNTRAAELQKVRASLNTKDAAAVKKFDLDVAAYTERNHAVAALQAKYTAAQAAK